MTDEALIIPSKDISTPPVILGDGSPTIAVEYLGEVWRSWPEHLRHLILHGGVRFELKPSEDQSTVGVEDNASKVVRLNTNTLPPWEPKAKDETALQRQELYYSQALYNAVLLAEARLTEGIDWEPARFEYRRSNPKGGSVSDVLSAAFGNWGVFKRTGNQQILDQEPNLARVLDRFNKRAQRISFEVVPDLQAGYGETIVCVSPRVITNVRDYGIAEQRDIIRFREMYSSWPKKHRELIEVNGVTFALGEEADLIPQAEVSSAKLVGIDIDALHEESILRNFRTTGRRVTKEMLQHAIEGKDLGWRALVTALGNGPTSIDWEAAKQEAVKNMPLAGRAQIDTQFVPDYVLSHAEYEARYAGGFSKLKANQPALVAVYRAYSAFVDDEYQKFQQETSRRIAVERTSRYQASDTAFAINYESGVLNRSQQECFERLNTIIRLLNTGNQVITPKDVDNQFRVMAAASLMANGDALAIYAANAYNDAVRMNEEERGRIAEKVVNSDDNWDSKNFELEEKLFPVLSGRPRGRKYDQKRYHTLMNLCVDATRTWAASYEPFLGICAISLPPLAREWEQDLIRLHLEDPDRYEKRTEDEELSVREYKMLKRLREKPRALQIDNLTVAEDTNLLQLYASGAKQLDELSGRQWVGEMEDISIRLPSAAQCMRNSIHNCTFHLVNKLGIQEPARTDIVAELKAIDELWPCVFMTPEQYHQYEITEADRARRDQLRLKEAAQRDAERLTKEKIEEEQQILKPETYVVASSAFSRIDKMASKGIHPTRTSPNGLYEVTNALMCFL